MTLYRWLQTPGLNSNSDATINWAEGQAPSTVNDSARAMMAAVAKYRDDTAGAIVTGGAVNAYAVTSYEGFDTLAHLSGQMIAFTPHITNTAATIISVDGLGGKPLRTAPGVELQSGMLIAGTPYAALYNNSDGAFYLFGVGPAPGVPLGAGFDFWGATTPGTAWAFPAGQAISRTTYAPLFSLLGATYGSGDGSTTFNLPDKTGRVSAMKEVSPARLTSSYFGGNSVSLGAVGGTESHTLTTGEMPSHNHSNTLTDPGHGHPNSFGTTQGTNLFNIITAAAPGANNTGSNTQQGLSIANNTTGITITNVNAGSGNPHVIVQPTIICNYIMRVL